MCPFSFLIVWGWPVAGATTSLRLVAARTKPDTMYVVSGCGEGRFSTSPNCCWHIPFTIWVNVTVTLATSPDGE